MDIFLLPETWISLLTLTFLEIVLGIDNIIFISIAADRLPKEQQAKARNYGLMLALLFRVGLLFGISWLVGLTTPWIEFDIFSLHVAMSGRDIILFLGGLFLIAKSTSEMHHKVAGIEAKGEEKESQKKTVSFSSILLQIVLLDIVFSFDSILTAVGLTDQIMIMVIAVVLAMGIMMIFAGKISAFINQQPTLQILALSFLVLIGFMLVVEAFHFHVPKGFIYFGVFYALCVELLNMKMRKNIPEGEE